jgi:hypothetical protein
MEAAAVAAKTATMAEATHVKSATASTMEATPTGVKSATASTMEATPTRVPHVNRG